MASVESQVGWLLIDRPLPLRSLRKIQEENGKGNSLDQAIRYLLVRVQAYSKRSILVGRVHSRKPWGHDYLRIEHSMKLMTLRKKF